MEWPQFDLRLSIGDVALRPVTDADLPAIGAMFPDDAEPDPRWEHFASGLARSGFPVSFLGLLG
jgi:hypothetical protein